VAVWVVLLTDWVAVVRVGCHRKRQKRRTWQLCFRSQRYSVPTKAVISVMSASGPLTKL